jgi:hypothetical protein
MASVTAAHQAAIANLYIALFNRAPDADGFRFWTEALANGASLDAIARTFVQTPEARALYPDTQTGEQFVTTYYASVLGRPIDADGLAFWTRLLQDAGGAGSAVARATVVSQIVGIVTTPLPVKPADLTDAAYALTFADRSAFLNKNVVAIFYATEYKGNDLNLAKQVLALVGPSASTIDVAKGLLYPPTSSGPAPIPSTPQIVTGTHSVDTSSGGTVDDTFRFAIDTATPANTTLNPGDSITGLAGNDTLIVTTTGPVTNGEFLGVGIDGIEALVIKRTDASVVSLTALAGLSAVTVEGGSGNFTVDGLASGTKVSLDATTGGTVTPQYAAGATQAVLSLAGGVTGTTLLLGAGSVTSATLTSSGSTNTLSSFNLVNASVSVLTLMADADLFLFTLRGSSAGGTDVTVSGTGAVTLALVDASVTRIDASANSGGLTATLAPTNTTVNVIGSSANDVITAGTAVLTTGTVDAGAGTADRLIVTDLTDLSGYTGFEVLQVQDGADVDVSTAVGITAIAIDDRSIVAGTTVSKLSAAQAAAITILRAGPIGTLTIGLNDASGSSDVVKASVMTTAASGISQNMNLSSLALTGIEMLELTGNGVTSGTGVIQLDTRYALSLKSISIQSTGRVDVSVDSAHAATNLVIDASASTGNGTLAASTYMTATGVTLKAGSGNYNLHGSFRDDVLVGGNGTDDLVGGGGNDLFVFNGGTAAIANADTIADLNLGSGTGSIDRLQFQNVATSTLVALDAGQEVTVTDAATLADATNVVLSIAVADGATARFGYNGDSYIVHNSDGNATFDNAVDYLVKINGYAGVLDLSDIVLV